MRNNFTEARAEFLRRNFMLRHYENMELPGQIINQEVHGRNEQLEMRINLMAHEHQSALRMKEVERESESRARPMIKDEEIVEMVIAAQSRDDIESATGDASSAR